MPKLILVLEDNADRRDAMRQCLDDRLPMYQLLLTDDPGEFLAYLRARASDVLVVSLDHDLYDRADGSTTITGMDVVDGLVNMSPAFPVLMHTTNRIDGERMRERLTEAGWNVTWVVPFDGTNWIPTDWYYALKRAIRTAAERERVPPADDPD